MNNEYYGAASTPTEDFLAHYGVKGMKWGVRKAVQSGNMRKLGRQYNKAAKKLAKLEKQAASGKKYAKRAVGLGAGAAAAGALAYQGTRGVSRLVGKTGGVVRKAGKPVGNALVKIGGLARNSSNSTIRNLGNKTAHAGRVFRDSGAANAAAALGNAGSKVATWGNSNSIGKAAARLGAQTGKVDPRIGAVLARGRNISNNTIVRAGTAAIGAGLGAGAAYNAYRAASTKRAAKKAAQFRSEMNKAFAGTAYANGRPASQKKKKRK